VGKIHVFHCLCAVWIFRGGAHQAAVNSTLRLTEVPHGLAKLRRAKAFVVGEVLQKARMGQPYMNQQLLFAPAVIVAFCTGAAATRRDVKIALQIAAVVFNGSVNQKLLHRVES
jgi:hypothetical protein